MPFRLSVRPCQGTSGAHGRLVLPNLERELPDLPDIRLGSNGTPSTVDVGPLPPRNQVTVEVEISPDTEVGPVEILVTRIEAKTKLGKKVMITTIASTVEVS